MKTPKRSKAKQDKVDVHDCAKGQMHHAVAQKVVRTMPGGFIA